MMNNVDGGLTIKDVYTLLQVKLYIYIFFFLITLAVGQLKCCLKLAIHICTY